MAEPTPTEQLPQADIKLVVSDLDGTLLTDDGVVPEGLWPIIDRLKAKGGYFVPASGRQYATLERLFYKVAQGMPFIAENGTFVVRDGREISSNVVDATVVDEVVRRLRKLVAQGELNIGVVICGKRSAYIERDDEVFLNEAAKYYAKLSVIPDLLTHGDEVLKVAVYDFDDAQTHTATHLEDLSQTHQVVVSGARWVDIMNQGVNKGVALAKLQEALGVSASETAVFGDYLNDLELMDFGDFSFAMANGHPDVLARANYVAPANTQDGVVQVLNALLPAAE